jgi:hypothetical protein
VRVALLGAQPLQQREVGFDALAALLDALDLGLVLPEVGRARLRVELGELFL